MSQSYTYSKTRDFTAVGDRIDTTLLSTEIQAASLQSVMHCINTKDMLEDREVVDVICEVVFEDELSASDEDLLGDVIAAHAPTEKIPFAEVLLSASEEVTTAATVYEPIPDLSTSLPVGSYTATLEAVVRNDSATGGSVFLAVFLDGIEIGARRFDNASLASLRVSLSFPVKLSVAEDNLVVEGRWRVSRGTGTLAGRSLLIRNS